MTLLSQTLKKYRMRRSPSLTRNQIKSRKLSGLREAAATVFTSSAWSPPAAEATPAVNETLGELPQRFGTMSGSKASPSKHMRRNTMGKLHHLRRMAAAFSLLDFSDHNVRTHLYIHTHYCNPNLRRGLSLTRARRRRGARLVERARNPYSLDAHRRRQSTAQSDCACNHS